MFPQGRPAAGLPEARFVKGGLPCGRQLQGGAYNPRFVRAEALQLSASHS